MNESRNSGLNTLCCVWEWCSYWRTDIWRDSGYLLKTQAFTTGPFQLASFYEEKERNDKYIFVNVYLQCKIKDKGLRDFCDSILVSVFRPPHWGTPLSGAPLVATVIVATILTVIFIDQHSEPP